MEAEDDASMISRAPPSRSEAFDHEDSPRSSILCPPPPPASEESLHPSVLSSWQNIVSTIKLKFEGDILPPSPRKQTCRVMNRCFIMKKRIPSFVFPSSLLYRNPLVSSRNILEILQSKALLILLLFPKGSFLKQYL